jgi:2-oxoisovalerate dehydrogenase E1 component
MDLSSKEFAMKIFHAMWTCRMVDEKMKKLVRQNKGGAFHLSTQGHEMIGSVMSSALIPGKDFAFPYYRDRAFALGLGCLAEDLFATLMGRACQHHSMGRMMPEHFSHKGLNIPCQSSVVGSQFLHAVGAAKALAMDGSDALAYVSGGDGATSQGDFHEALNFASIHQLPVIFCIQDNQLAISVMSHEQTAGGDCEKLIRGFPGVEVIACDGTDFTQTVMATEKAVDRARKKLGPTVVIARVPRLGAHSSSDDPTKYLSEKMIQETLALDPLDRFEKYLQLNFFLSIEELTAMKQQIQREVELAAIKAEEVPHPDPKSVMEHLYHPTPVQQEVLDTLIASEPIVMVDAINHAIIEAMEQDPSIVVFGQDVAHGKGGVFGVTRSLTEKFGDRCFNTPLAESTIMGVALGMSLVGSYRPIAEIQFADYIWTGINQLFNEIASFSYRSNGEWNVPVVIRMPIGGYIQGGPYHSQSIEAFLAHCPGLKIVFPSNAHDAKGLMKAAIKDPNPVIFLEHKGLYRQRAFSARSEPGSRAIIPLGKAQLVKEGKDLTIVTWGMLTVMGHECVSQLEKEGYSCDLIDLRTLIPLDEEAILRSVKKTGKLLIAHEACKTCGFSAEISARISESCFEFLDAPIQRLCGLDAPVAYSKVLEEANLPSKHQLLEAIRKLIAY